MGEDGPQRRALTPAPELPASAIPLDTSTKAPTIAAKMGSIEKQTKKTASWNTKNLGLRLGADFAAAASAGVLVAPIITMIDKGIIENASGRNTLGGSLKQSLAQLVFRPHHFLFSRPFALIFSLYCGTYMTANALDTTVSTIGSQPASSITAGPSKFVATSTSNLALCLYKDNRFTQLFGAAANPKPVPAATFILFGVRDCLTIAASFNLPPILAPHFDKRMSEEVKRYVSGISTAQFLTPAAVQLISTPLHLLGLDLYNREGVTWRERFTQVSKNWAMSSFARMGRIIPAFGVGGVVNMRVRKGLMEKLE